MNPETRAYKIPNHHHSLTSTQTKNKQIHQPLGKIKSNKIYGSPTKIYFLVLLTLFKRSNSAKKSKISRLNLQVACEGHQTINLKIFLK
jgi:hypothetical protein